MSTSRSRTTSNQTTNQTATTTPQAPSWLQGPTQDYIGRVTNLMNQGGPFVAGPSTLQQQAFDGASRLGNGPTINLPGMGGRGGVPGMPKPGNDNDGPQIAGGGGDGYVSPNAGSGGGQGGGRTANVFDIAGLLGLSGGTAGPNLTGGTALSRFTGYDPAGQAETQGYDPAGRTGGQGYTASGPFVPQGYDPSLATGQGYTANGYTASGPAGAEGYDPATYQATTGQGRGYDAVTGQGRGYQAATINPAAFGVGQSTIGPMAQASSRNFTDVDLQGYLNPYTGEVQDAFTADFDANAGRVRAQQAAQQAANGGLRNSNNAVLSALTEGELARARGSGVAGIRSQGFNTAAGLATGDLDRQASVSQFNAGQTNQGALAQAQIDASRNSLEAQLRQAGLLANQDAFNRASEFGATADNTFGLANMDARNRASEFGADAANRFGLANMDALNQAGQFNTGQRNAASQFGADARNRSALDFAGRTDQAGQFTAGQQNQAGQFNAGLAADISRFNAGAQNDARSLLSQQLQQAGLDFAGRQDQAGQFGADAANRADLDFAARRDAAGQFGADAFNRSALDFAGRRDAAGQFGADAFNRNSQLNAGAINQNSQFNAGQMDNDLARRLQAAGLLTNLGATMGADNRANIGLQAELGGQQRGIENAQLQEEYARLALLQQLLGVDPNRLIGQTSTGQSTSNGSETTRSFGVRMGWSPQGGFSIGG